MDSNNTEAVPSLARDYKRDSYQNFMDVFDALKESSPMPMSRKQIQEATKLSKSQVFDITWNMEHRGWAKIDGMSISLKQSATDKDSYVGRMVKRIVIENCKGELKELLEAS